MVLVVKLQFSQVSPSIVANTVEVELPELVILPRIVDSHSFSMDPPVVSQMLHPSDLAAYSVPTGSIHPPPQLDVAVVVQRTVAEAELAPTNAVRAAAAEIVRPRILSCFNFMPSLRTPCVGYAGGSLFRFRNPGVPR